MRREALSHIADSGGALSTPPRVPGHAPIGVRELEFLRKELKP
jgi:hypothetical protein